MCVRGCVVWCGCVACCTWQPGENNCHLEEGGRECMSERVCTSVCCEVWYWCVVVWCTWREQLSFGRGWVRECMSERVCVYEGVLCCMVWVCCVVCVVV